MPITFRHDAAGVVPPSNQTTRKYGQQLVLQQNQQKYAAQQKGLDRMFTLGRDQQQASRQAVMLGEQNARQAIRDATQFANNQTLQDSQNKFAMDQQRARDFDAARSRMDAYAKDMLSSGQITDRETQNKIQNLIAGKTIVMGYGFNETAQKEYLDKYNAELAKIMSEVPPPKAKPTRDEELKSFLGGSYDTYKHLPWTPDGKGGFAVSKEASAAMAQQQKDEQAKRPKSFQDYYGENEDKFQSDLDATMSTMEVTDPKTGKITPATPEEALAKMRKDYEFRQKALGRIPSPTIQPATIPPAQGAAEMAYMPKPAPTPTGQTDANGFVIMSDGSKVDPRDSAAMKSGGGISQDVMRFTNPDGTPIQTSPDDVVAEIEVNRADGRPLNKTRDGRTVLGDPRATGTPILEQAGQAIEQKRQAVYEAMQQRASEDGSRIVGPSEALLSTAETTIANATEAQLDAETAFNARSQGANPWSEVATPRPRGELPVTSNESSANPARQARGAMPVTSNESSQNPSSAEVRQPAQPVVSAPQPTQGGITIQAASEAAKQYEGAAQQLQSLQASASDIEGKILALSGKGGRSGVLSSNNNKRLSELKSEQKRIKDSLKSTQSAMDQADKAVRSYHDQQIAQQPAAQNLAKAGKRPQDFAEAEYQLRNLRKQYPDMASMPAEAKKQLKEAMAVIQAGR